MALQLESWEGWCTEILIREVLDSAVPQSNPDSAEHKRSHSCFKGLEISFFLDWDFTSTASHNLSFQNWKDTECVTEHDFQLQGKADVLLLEQGWGMKGKYLLWELSGSIFPWQLGFQRQWLRLCITLRCLWQDQENEQCKKTGKICTSAWQMRLSQVSASAMWSWLWQPDQHVTSANDRR